MEQNRIIDLRSDTVTRPTAGMRKAIAEAEVGDDVFGEDPTVTKLEERVAKLLRKEAALFVPSGVMANQLAMKVLTHPGDEVIVERGSHIFNYETAAPALLSHVQLHPVEGRRGFIQPSDIEAAIRPNTYYMPRTSLVCVENTHNRAGGTVYPLETMAAVRSFATSCGLRVHLDGARIWNAWVASGVHPGDYAVHADTVAVCFSKGLGAPVGSALASTREHIERARKFRKIFGGGMRQAGILAAGALYALEHHVDRLAEDHHKARAFALLLSDIHGISIDMNTVETNIVVIDIAETGKPPAAVITHLQKLGILVTEAGPTSIRAVMHMDVSMDDVRAAAERMRKHFAQPHG
jgi:threonine aldolase